MTTHATLKMTIIRFLPITKGRSCDSVYTLSYTIVSVSLCSTDFPVVDNAVYYPTEEPPFYIGHILTVACMYGFLLQDGNFNMNIFCSNIGVWKADGTRTYYDDPLCVEAEGISE